MHRDRDYIAKTLFKMCATHPQNILFIFITHLFKISYRAHCAYVCGNNTLTLHFQKICPQVSKFLLLIEMQHHTHVLCYYYDAKGQAYYTKSSQP